MEFPLFFSETSFAEVPAKFTTLKQYFYINNTYVYVTGFEKNRVPCTIINIKEIATD